MKQVLAISPGQQSKDTSASLPGVAWRGKSQGHVLAVSARPRAALSSGMLCQPLRLRSLPSGPRPGEAAHCPEIRAREGAIVLFWGTGFYKDWGRHLIQGPVSFQVEMKLRKERKGVRHD